MTDKRAQSESQADTDDLFELLLREAAHVSSPRPSSAPPLLRPGSTLLEGRLRVIRRIGDGGMGVVYETFDELRRSNVALKTLHRLDATNVYRLKNEFRSLCEVSHSGLCHLHELFSEDGQWFFTMELVDGELFDRWVRPHGVLDEARLRAALRQLTEGVAAIHAAGKLHRDLKPSNVLVARDGRVVVLDFGLAMDPELGGVGQTVLDDGVSGTPAYMAPEQAAGQPATAASDLYAIGVMLFEALTGRLPFKGGVLEMIGAKQHRDAPPVHTVLPHAPSDLAALADALLSRGQEQRPGVVTLLARFAAASESPSDAPSWSGTSVLPLAGSLAPPAGPDVTLLGRELELGTLRDAFAASCSGDKPVIVLLAGESGMGKSALCEAFLSELRAQRRAVVLSGRCFERESVPFKAFDVVVDELSRYLRKLGDDARDLMPRDTFALRRIFPVLERVTAIAASPERHVPDAHDLRQRAFSAFGELLGRVRDRTPLVLHLDDLQWSDTDSTILLMHLVRQVDAPRMLLIASHRSEQLRGHPHLSPLYETLPLDTRLDVRTLQLQPLTTEAAQALLTATLGSAPTELMREAGGNPYLLSELGRHVAARDGQAVTDLSVRRLVESRAAALAGDARRLLHLLSVAGRPIELELAVAAARSELGPRTLFETLRDAHLARATGYGALVECFHDKVREAVLGTLAADELCRYHAALARVLLARADSDAEQLAVHLLGAGEIELAAVQFARAADVAHDELSFDRAVRLYTQALADGRFEPAERQRLRVARADALSAAGRGALAAEAYLEAMQSAHGEAVHALEHRAAEEYLLSGRITDGRALLTRWLGRRGVRLPTSSAATLASLVIERTRLGLRGIDFQERPASPAVIEQLDTMYPKVIELLRADAAAGAVLQTRQLRLALRSGDAVQVARHLTIDIFNRAMGIGDPASVPDVLARVQTQLARTPDPVATLWLHYCRGWYLEVGPEPDLDAALAEFDCHLALLDEQKPPNAAYHRNLATVQRVSIRVWLGRLAEVARELPDLLDAAFELGDFIALPLMASSFNPMALIAVGALDEAERQFERASAAWESCKNPYAMQDVCLLLGAVSIALARDQPRMAWERAREGLTRFTASPSRRVPLLAGVVRGATAIAALALAESTRGSERDDLLRFARAQERGGVMPQMGPLVALGRASLEGPRARAAEVARTTAAQLHGLTWNPLYYQLSRRACGELLGDQGAPLVAEADAFLRAGGCKDPESYCRIWTRVAPR